MTDGIYQFFHNFLKLFLLIASFSLKNFAASV